MNRIFDVLTSPWYSEYNRLDNYDSDNWRFVVAEKLYNAESSSELRRQKKNLIYNQRTGDFFTPDTVDIVALKSYLLFLANPIHVGGAVLYNFRNAVAEPVIVFFKAVKWFKEDFRNEQLLKRIYKTLFTSVCVLTTSTLRDLYYILRNVFYGIGIQIVYLEGFLSDSYRAKVKMGTIERSWNHEISFKRSFCIQYPARSEFEQMSWSEYFQRLQNIETFYIAPCMQKRGNMRDEIAVAETPTRRWRILAEEGSIRSLRLRHSEYFPDLQRITLTKICSGNPGNFTRILNEIGRSHPEYLENLPWMNSAMAAALERLRQQNPQFEALIQEIKRAHPEYFDDLPEECGEICPVSRAFSFCAHAIREIRISFPSLAQS